MTPIEKNTTVIIVITIIVFVAGGYIVWSNLPLTTKIKDDFFTKSPSSKEAQMSIEIGENSTTTAVFTGYYTTLQKKLSEEGELNTCNVFITYKNEDPLFLYFSILARDGNTVNSFDNDGNLILKISFDRIAIITQQKIIASTKENPITLVVQKRSLTGKGAGPCTSFVDILSVK